MATNIWIPKTPEDVAVFKPTRQLAELLERHRGNGTQLCCRIIRTPTPCLQVWRIRMICARREIEVDLLYEGGLPPGEPRALQLLEVPLVRVTDETDLRIYHHSVFVDTRGPPRR